MLDMLFDAQEKGEGTASNFHTARATKRVLRRQQACAADVSHSLRPMLLQMSQKGHYKGPAAFNICCIAFRTR